MSACKVGVVEDLASLMDRVGWAEHAMESARKQPRRRVEPAGAKWRGKHASFKKMHGLTDEEMQAGDLQGVIAGCRALGISERGIEATHLQLCLQKRSAGFDIAKQIMVGNVGDNVGYLTFKSRVHPCVLPKRQNLYIVQGTVQMTQSASLSLALQGLGPREVKQFGLAEISYARSLDLAGNAFTSNVVAAILVNVLQLGLHL